LGDPPSSQATSLRPVSEVPEEIDEAGDAFLEAMLAYLVFLYNWRVRVSRGGALRREDQAALHAYVEEHARPLAEKGTLGFLGALAQELGLVRAQEGRLRPDPGPARVWLEAPSTEALLTLQRAWLETRRWNDLWHVPSLRCEQTGWANDPRLARQAVTAVLARLDSAVWYAVEDLVEAIHRENPDFQRPGGDYDSWFIRDLQSGRYLHGFEDWPCVEGALVRYLVTGPLHWLGVVDLGGAGAFFRVTGWSEGAAKEESPGPVALAGDLELSVPAGASRYQRFQLARLAVWEAGGPPYRYRLTPSSVGRAFRQGVKREQVEGFLARLTGATLPKEVRRALRLWETQAREVRLRRVVVVEVRDAGILDRLQEDAAVGATCGNCSKNLSAAATQPASKRGSRHLARGCTGRY